MQFVRVADFLCFLSHKLGCLSCGLVVPNQFPSENGWDSWLSSHGGATNASTDSEYTVYNCSVNAEHLDKALLRLSQFFIAPLFNASAVEREINAINSEFTDSYQDDELRASELLCFTTDKSGHPYARWGWGNNQVRPFIHHTRINHELPSVFCDGFESNPGPAFKICISCIVPHLQCC